MLGLGAIQEPQEAGDPLPADNLKLEGPEKLTMSKGESRVLEAVWTEASACVPSRLREVFCGAPGRLGIVGKLLTLWVFAETRGSLSAQGHISNSLGAALMESSSCSASR